MSVSVRGDGRCCVLSRRCHIDPGRPVIHLQGEGQLNFLEGLLAARRARLHQSAQEGDCYHLLLTVPFYDDFYVTV